MMKCVRYVLIGAIAAPLAMAAGMTFIFGPALIADKWLGINPLWGFVFTLAFAGGAAGAAACRSER